MNRFLTENGWAIFVSIAVVAGNYAIMGYQISDINRRLTVDEAAISVNSTQQVQTDIALGEIQTDLTYIKAAVDKLSGQ